MVTRSISNFSNSTSDTDHNDQDSISVESNELAIVDESFREKPSFGNIAVSNSSDIIFGNKTYYQGPVTIKQFLYASPQISNSDECDDKTPGITNDSLVLDRVPYISCNNNVGKDNAGFVPDTIGIKTTNDFEKKIINIEQQHGHVEKGASWIQNFSRQHLFLIISLTAVLLVSLVTLMSVLLTRHQPIINKPITSSPNGDSSEQNNNTPIEYPIDPNVNLTLPGKLKIVSRKEWLAQPPVQDAEPLHLPIQYVVILHTATENCSDQASCTFHVRYLQTYHIESKHWWDISYNFLVGGDGYAYEGRGWKSEGAHTYGYNYKSLGIAFIGTFNQILPPERQIIAAKQLIQKGLELKYIAPNYKLVGEKQLDNTQSPGLLLYENLKTWPHWVENP